MIMAVAQRAVSARWLQWVAGMCLAAFVAYFTTTSSIEVKMAELRTTQQGQFEQIQRQIADGDWFMQRQLTEINTSIRELRASH